VVHEVTCATKLDSDKKIGSYYGFYFSMFSSLGRMGYDVIVYMQVSFTKLVLRAPLQ
jgi:hypothetical protein